MNVLPVTSRTTEVVREESVVHKERHVSEIMKLVRMEQHMSETDVDTVSLKFMVIGTPEEKAKVYQFLSEVWGKNAY